MDVKIGNYSGRSATQYSPLTNVMLWGPAGAGKTTLAGTMPGRKLVLGLDDGGDKALAGRTDTTVVPLGNVKGKVLLDDMAPNTVFMRDLEKALVDYGTLVLDSATTLNYKAMDKSVSIVPKATLLVPHQGGYGTRNAVVLLALTTLLEVCARTETCFCLIAHEQGNKDSEGRLVGYGIMLGGGLPNQIVIRFDECWHLSDLGNRRRIMVRPHLLREICKTRIFAADAGQEFDWVYNPDTDEGMKIADWIDARVSSTTGIALPK